MASIHKSYLISLAAFFGINITFGLIYITLTRGFEGFNPLSILGLLVLSIFYLPSYLISAIIGSGGNLALILLAIGAIAAPVVAAVLSGYFGESKGACFGGWGLTVITSYVIVIILTFVAFPIVLSLFGDISSIFSQISATFQEEPPTTLEIYIVLDTIGATISPLDIIIYRYFAVEFGGLQNVLELILGFYAIHDWDAETTIFYSFIFKEISDKSFLEQYLLLKLSLGWDFDIFLEYIPVFNAFYTPIVPTIPQIITKISITAGINGILYGLFALGARRAAFY